MISSRQRRLRKELNRLYTSDLLRRVRRVPCPTCRAKRGERCRNRGRLPKQECHINRHREARRAGLVRIQSWREARKFQEEARGSGYQKRLSSACKRMLKRKETHP